MAIKNGMVLYTIPYGEGGLLHKIFNSKNNTTDQYRLHSFDWGIRSNKIIIFSNWGTKLLYYKPGMKDFNEIPNTDILNKDELYFNGNGLSAKINGKIVTDKLGDKLVLTVYKYGAVLPSPYQEQREVVKSREVTFDLSTLP